MPEQKTDRRSLRTRRILLDALVALMQEKPYEAITVQDVLDRADIGRSTFYAHYPDKEALMVDMLERMMNALSKMSGESPAAGGPRLAPLKELFEHVKQNQRLFSGVMRGRAVDLFYEKGQAYLNQMIANELTGRLPAGRQPAIPIPVLAQFVSGTMVTMLRWWLENKMPYSPSEMDTMLHRLVMPGIQNGLTG